MNCKQGDFAKYVGMYPELRGRVVLCLRRAQDPLIVEPAWVVTPPIPWPDADLNPNWAADRVLRPVDVGDGADETLSWKEVPAPSVPAQAIQSTRALIAKVSG
jgi:hypothetical protein